MISIYTLNGYRNYGNRLQLFALSTIVNSMVDDELVTYWLKTRKEQLKEIIKFYTPLSVRYKKELKMRRFTTKYLPKTTKKSNSDIVIVGSDQVWNPNCLKNRRYLLEINNKSRKISYAASIGYDNLSEKQLKLFTENLNDFSKVSVREESAKKILEPLYHGNIEVVLDPTLLLKKEKYEALEKRPKDIAEDDKYVLCYILGNRDHESKIEKFAKENRYRTIYFSDKRDSSYGVEEFLYLIHHAQLVCTDSFHACVFSFIFERPFVAFRRTGEANYMYSRLQGLIDTFRLKDREYNGRKITEANLRVDYSEAKKILKKEQEKSISYLKGALGIKK